MKRHEHGHIGWVDLAVTDMDSQTVFYEDLFGWQHSDVPTYPGGPPYRMFTLAGRLVAAAAPMPPDMPPGMPSMWNTYVTVDDAEAIAAKATDLGGVITMPLMQVMTSGRMVGVNDPTGGMLYFWEPQDHVGAEVYGEPGSVLWNDLNTRDMAAAADYYEALLGWKIDRSSGDDSNYWAFAVAGDGEGGIMDMGEEFPPDVPAHWLVYFAADDAQAITERAKGLGGSVVMEPMEIPICIFSVIADPAGATFAVMQMKPM